MPSINLDKTPRGHTAAVKDQCIEIRISTRVVRGQPKRPRTKLHRGVTTKKAITPTRMTDQGIIRAFASGHDTHVDADIANTTDTADTDTSDTDADADGISS